MKVGVVGTGSMGKKHARVYSSLPEYCQLVGVYDLNYDSASNVAEEHGCVAFHSLQDLLKQVDAVSVVVPTPAHYQIGLQCVNQNVHVVMEKPITETVHQAKKLIEKANSNKVVLQVGHIELFNSTVQVLKELLDNEDIISMELSRLRPQEARITHVDVVSDSMIHDIYIVFHLLGSQVHHLYALGKQYNHYTKHATVLLQFHDGAIVQLTASYLTDEKVRTIRVITKESIIVADLLNKSVQKSNLLIPNSSQSIFVPNREPLRLELIHFIDSINNNQIPKVTGEDGLAALSLVNKIIKKISIS